MKILLTGSSGYLGEHIRNVLSDGHEIHDLNRIADKNKIRLESEVPEIDEQYDLVVHCAGRAHVVERTVQQSREMIKVNSLGTLNLLKGLERSKLPSFFVLISSVAVYGKISGLNLTENEPLEASDSYGLSKIIAEEFVLNWCNKNGVKCTILRLPLVVGQNPPGNLKAMLKGIKYGYYFNVEGGKARKSMVLADDVGRFIPIIARQGGIFNLTDGIHPSFLELSSRMSVNSKIWNMPIFVAKGLAYGGDKMGKFSPFSSSILSKLTSDLTFDDSLARNFGWKPNSVLLYLENKILNNFN